MTVIFGDMNWTVRLLTISQTAEPDYRAFGNQESFLIAQTFNNDISRSQRQAMPIRGGHFNAARLEHQECAVQRVARLLVRDGERGPVDQPGQQASRHLSHRFGNVR